MDMFSQQAHNIDFERGNRPTPNMEMQEKKNPLRHNFAYLQYSISRGGGVVTYGSPLVPLRKIFCLAAAR